MTIIETYRLESFAAYKYVYSFESDAGHHLSCSRWHRRIRALAAAMGEDGMIQDLTMANLGIRC